MSKYKIGSIVTGLVSGIEDYGIFVHLDDYYSGLIHISEISDKFVRDINKIVSIGDTINVKILSVDENTCHLKLSIKNIKYKDKKQNNVLIEEVGSGFGILSDNLNNWIEETKKDLNL